MLALNTRPEGSLRLCLPFYFGIFFFADPGSGKTMLARALAAEGGACFLELRSSSVTSKWFGESVRLVSAAFSLAGKMAPSVIFVDEIDALLGARGGDGVNEASVHLKAEFLTLWDGLTTSDNMVMVLGATNRPYDVDPAILRRMPRTFHVSLPNKISREDILRKLLEGQTTTREARQFLPELANLTEGYSGSDLRELCRTAAMGPVSEAARRARGGAGNEVRPVNSTDLRAAQKRVKATGVAAADYERDEEAGNGPQWRVPGGSEGASGGPRRPQGPRAGNLDLQGLVQGLAMIQNLMDAGGPRSNGLHTGINGHERGNGHCPNDENGARHDNVDEPLDDLAEVIDEESSSY